MESDKQICSKVCKDCGEDKPLKEFYRAGKNATHSYCKLCHKKRSDLSRETHKEARRANVTVYQRTPKGRFVKGLTSAKKRGIGWNLTEEFYYTLLGKPCEYCGQDINEFGVAIDRMDSACGYEADNVVPCCSRCNKMKNCFLTHTEMKLIWSLRLGKEI